MTCVTFYGSLQQRHDTVCASSETAEPLLHLWQPAGKCNSVAFFPQSSVGGWNSRHWCHALPTEPLFIAGSVSQRPLPGLWGLSLGIIGQRVQYVNSTTRVEVQFPDGMNSQGTTLLLLGLVSSLFLCSSKGTVLLKQQKSVMRSVWKRQGKSGWNSACYNIRCQWGAAAACMGGCACVHAFVWLCMLQWSWNCLLCQFSMGDSNMHDH